MIIESLVVFNSYMVRFLIEFLILMMRIHQRNYGFKMSVKPFGGYIKSLKLTIAQLQSCLFQDIVKEAMQLLSEIIQLHLCLLWLL